MSKSLFLRETVWLWVGILLMAVVPQLSIFRVGGRSLFFFFIFCVVYYFFRQPEN